MSRCPHALLAGGAATLLAACSGQDSQAPAGLATARGGASYTTQPSQATLVSRNGELVPILTVGDSVPSTNGGTTWAPIPDGLGGYQQGSDLVLYANHELSSSGGKDVNGVTQFAYARVSRLVLDPRTLTVKDASYVITGSEQYQRLCSATFADAGEGFPSGYFFTGEESTGGTHDGMQLAIGKDGVVHELPWIGRIAHENLTAAPYSGALKVNEPIASSWIEVPNSAALSSAALQTTVTDLGAFPFVRLEDSDYDHRVGTKPALYFVDTGSESTLCNGAPCDAYGSIYRLEFDPTNPAGTARLILLARSAGAATGWSSPDNIAHNGSSLMVQEDPANSTFAGQRSPQIYKFAPGPTGRLGKADVVVSLTNPTCNDVAGTCWESSGIIDASKWFGPGSWLFDVQAHTLPVPLMMSASVSPTYM